MGDGNIYSHDKMRDNGIIDFLNTGKEYPTRISCTFKKKKGQIVIDQIRTIDKSRLIKRLGTIDPNTQLEVIAVLQRLFAF